jgi:hypothetical protein
MENFMNIHSSLLKVVDIQVNPDILFKQSGDITPQTVILPISSIYKKNTETA